MQLVIAIIAIVALILASVSMIDNDDDGEEEHENGDEENISPTAVISNPVTEIGVGTLVSFNGSLSSDSDGNIIEYTWDFGDGNKDSGMYSSYFYTDAGTYSVSLKVIDDEGASDIDSTTITVLPNEAPIAEIVSNVNVSNTWEFIYFNASDSYDPDGNIIEYTWDFGDGTKDSGMYTNHIYSIQGVYSVILTVTDDDGASDSDTFEVIVYLGSNGGDKQNLPPIAQINASATQAEAGDTLSFNGLNSTDPDGTIVQYLWYIDDEIWDDGILTVYNRDDSGTYNLTLKVIDNNGASNTTTISFNLTPNTPSISVSWYEDPNEVGNYTGALVSIAGLYYISIGDVQVTVSHGNSTDSDTLLSLNTGNTLIVEDLTLDFTDVNANGYFGAEDVMRITNGISGDTISFIYLPSGGEMGYSTLP